jgi:exosortase
MTDVSRKIPGVMKSGIPYLIFAALCAISIAALFRPLAATISLAFDNDEFTHILLILPISAALIISEWTWLKLKSSPSPRMGGILIGFGVVIVLITRRESAELAADTQVALKMLALLTLLIAAFVFSFGSAVARSSIFSLGFLFWMVPIPSLLLTQIVHWLQAGSAISASLLFLAAGVPVSRAGNVLLIPGLNIEVARECSSIRSSLMLLVTTMVLAHLLLRSPWRKAAAILFAVPLSVAKNGLRIFVISILGTRVDRGFLNGWLHQQGGIIFLLIALAIIMLVIWFLRAQEQAPPDKARLHLARVDALQTTSL